MKVSPTLLELRKKLPDVLASVEVDVMKTFSELCPDELPVSGALEIVSPINKLSEKVSLRVGTKCAHSEKAVWRTDKNTEIGAKRNDLQAPHKWKMHGVPGTLGFEMLDGMPEPTEYDFFVWKGMELGLHPYGACYHDPLNKISTGLIEYLLINDVTTVVVTGLAYDYCVKETALELAGTGLFKVVVIKECTRGIAPENFNSVEKELNENGVEIINTVNEL